MSKKKEKNVLSPFLFQARQFSSDWVPHTKKSHSCVPEMTKVGPSTLTDITQSQDQEKLGVHDACSPPGRLTDTELNCHE